MRRTALLGLALVSCGDGPPRAETGRSALTSSRLASFDDAGLADCDQLNASAGTLSLDGTRSFDGTRSVRADYTGNNATGAIRCVFTFEAAPLDEGDDVWWGAAYFLPLGAQAQATDLVTIAKLDDFLTHPADTDEVQLRMRPDKRWRLERTRTPAPSVTLLGPFDSGFPEDRWFTVGIHQRLSSADGGALNEVFIDGVSQGSSTVENFAPGRPLERSRYGLSLTQAAPFTLWFDAARLDVTSPRVDAGSADGGVGASPRLAIGCGCGTVEVPAVLLALALALRLRASRRARP